MSMCPKKDIHSLYLDDELPSEYKAEYESHVKNCPKCAKELKALESLRSLMQANDSATELSPSELNSSFDRLNARLSYSRVVKDKSTLPFRPVEAIRYVAVGVAAALAVAIILPQRGTRASSSASNVAFEPVARSSMALPVSTTVYVDGELSLDSLSNLFETDVSSSDSFANQSLETLASYNTLPFAQKTQATVNPTSTLASYDVFTPVAQPYTEPQEEKNAFSVEFSLGSFHFKAKGSR